MPKSLPGTFYSGKLNTFILKLMEKNPIIRPKIQDVINWFPAKFKQRVFQKLNEELTKSNNYNSSTTVGLTNSTSTT